MNSCETFVIKGTIISQINLEGNILTEATVKGELSKASVIRKDPLIDNETIIAIDKVLSVNTSKKVENSKLPVTSKAVNDALNNFKESTVKTVNGILPNTNGNVDVKECISGEELSELLIMIK